MWSWVALTQAPPARLIMALHLSSVFSSRLPQPIDFLLLGSNNHLPPCLLRTRVVMAPSCCQPLGTALSLVSPWPFETFVNNPLSNPDKVGYLFLPGLWYMVRVNPSVWVMNLYCRLFPFRVVGSFPVSTFPIARKVTEKKNTSEDQEHVRGQTGSSEWRINWWLADPQTYTSLTQTCSLLEKEGQNWYPFLTSLRWYRAVVKKSGSGIKQIWVGVQPSALLAAQS